MCGIAGYVGGEACAPLLVGALRRLEYRGYDSAGVATVHGGCLHVRKDAGRVEDVDRRLGLSALPGTVGVAHTRWATHGAPTTANAHPHTDCTGSIAIVHNGIIENFLALKRELQELDHSFSSRTDSEVIAHLVEEYLKRGEGLEEAFRKTLTRLEGSYAVALLSARHPGVVLAARRESPLIIGVGRGFNMVASDLTALLDATREIVFLGDGEMVVLTAEGYRILRVGDGAAVERAVRTVEMTVEMAEKQGHPHFMLKEIYEQPEALRNALRLQIEYVDLVAELLDRGGSVFLLGSGTSYNACVAGSYLFSALSRLPALPVVASEFVANYGGAIGVESVILAVSQSGETADVLNALEFARMRACTILGVTNTVGSTLTRVSRAYVLQNAGPEIGVGATKTFTSQIMVLAQIALRLARLRGKMAQYEMDEFRAAMSSVPRVVEELLAGVGQQVKPLAERLAGSRVVFFLGRGVSTSTALEGRLKLMELSYIPCVAYPAGESKHGPISVIEKDVPTIFVAPPDEYRRLNISSIMEVKSRGAYVVVLGDSSDGELR